MIIDEFYKLNNKKHESIWLYWDKFYHNWSSVINIDIIKDLDIKLRKKKLNRLINMKKEKLYITCSAILFNDGIKHDHQPFNIETGFVICGHRHHNCFMTAYILNDNEKVKGLKEIQGFMTNKNNFVDRKEAGEIAFNAGQTSELKEKLFSEDIY